MSAQDARVEGRQPLTDEALIRAAAGGDWSAFEQFVERHRAAVWRHLRTLAPRTQDAEDAMQEAFLAVWRAAGGFRGECSAKKWLFTIARHAAFRQRRAQPLVNGLEVTELDELARLAGFASESPEQLAARAQCAETLRRALDSLSAEDREIVTLRDLDGLSGEETAEVLGLSLTAMKSRLHRARLRLAAALNWGGAL